ncbi:hypothetical protein [Nostocoides sp. HKS02]|uniref:hypothetical protein n=1 Tax=Nostocoides sp. HKS02 TaxID=1813880 RepID=UPI0012B49290|nr:hypothetical protein [Tetrasphaera sp. HKS02]QGN58860.1 hypothetical protein GKE56_14305 [Tetrasphaera sp. HKS02]
MDELDLVASQVAPNLAIDEGPATRTALDEDDADDTWSSYTVVEMAIPLVKPFDHEQWQPASVEDSVMGENLTMCIEALLHLLDAYRLVTKTVMRPPARERLGPFILAGTRPAELSGDSWDHPPYQVLNVFALAGQPGIRRTATEAEIRRMSTYLHQKARRYPITAVLELQADGEAALEIAGDFRSSVMLYYSAGEVFLDLALMLMLWEEGKAASEAALVFDPPLLVRVRTEYHTRLGGNWQPQGRSAVAEWRANLVQMRHQVAHAGKSPTREEAEAARDAHRRLIEGVGTRFAAKVRRYPRSLSLLVAREALERRGRVSRAADDALKQLTTEVMLEFLDWRDAVLIARSKS